MDRAYLTDHLPLNLQIEEEPLWDTYHQWGAKRLLRDNFYQVLFEEVHYDET